MPLEYRSITANCGNDTLGSNACEEISQLLIDDKADFLLLIVKKLILKILESS